MPVLEACPPRQPHAPAHAHSHTLHVSRHTHTNTLQRNQQASLSQLNCLPCFSRRQPGRYKEREFEHTISARTVLEEEFRSVPAVCSPPSKSNTNTKPNPQTPPTTQPTPARWPHAGARHPSLLCHVCPVLRKAPMVPVGSLTRTVSCERALCHVSALRLMSTRAVL
jgi:hypothetical protein